MVEVPTPALITVRAGRLDLVGGATCDLDYEQQVLGEAAIGRPPLRGGSPEGESISLHARIEKLDLELSIGDGLGLSDQLVQPQLGAFANRADVLRKLVERLERRGGQLRFCYEAGPCGYGLHRFLTGLGHACAVVAPSLIPINAGDRIKTDRRVL